MDRHWVRAAIPMTHLWHRLPQEAVQFFTLLADRLGESFPMQWNVRQHPVTGGLTELPPALDTQHHHLSQLGPWVPQAGGSGSASAW